MNDKYYKELATTLINTCDAETFFRILKQSIDDAYNNGYTDGYYDASYNQDDDDLLSQNVY